VLLDVRHHHLTNQTPPLRYAREDLGMGEKLSEQPNKGKDNGRETVFIGHSDPRRPTWIFASTPPVSLLYKRSIKPRFFNCRTLLIMVSCIATSTQHITQTHFKTI